MHQTLTLTLFIYCKKKLIRIIHGKHYLTPSSPLFQTSSLLPVHALYQFKILLLSHKIYLSQPLHSTHNYLLDSLNLV